MLRQNDGNGAGCRRPRLSKMAKQVAKSISCVCLCAVLVVGTSYKRPVHGVMTGIAIGGAVFVATALTSLGICAAVDTIINGKTYGQACADIWDKWVADPVKQAVQNTASLVSSARVTFRATGDFLRSCFDGACQEIPQVTHWDNWSSAAEIESALNIDTIYPAFVDDLDYFHDINLMTDFEVIYPVTEPTPNAVTLDYNGIKFVGRYSNVQYVWDNSDPKHLVWRTYKGVSFTTMSDDYDWHQAAIGQADNVNFSFVNGFIPAGTYRVFSALWGSQTDRTIVFVNSSGFNYWELMADTGVTIPETGQDLFNPATDKIYADGKSAMNTKVDDVIDGVQDKVGVANPDTGEVEIPLTAPNVGSADDPDVRSQSQSDVLGKDIADDSDRDRDRDTNKDRDTSAPKPSDIPDLSIPEMVTRKFPFSIPWDLYNAVHVLVAPGKAPSFDVPFKIQSLGVDYTMHLDLAQFQPLANIVRWGLSLLFLIALIILTNKVIKH